MYNMLLEDGAVWFTAVAFVTTMLFSLTVLMLFVGGDGGIDAGGDLDVPDGGGDGGFKVLSFQGIVGFGMGWGWGGLVAYRSLEWAWPSAAITGIGTGLLFLWMLWIGFKALHDLTGDGNVHARDTVGHEGTVTVAIPESGTGRVRLVLGSRQREFRAAANGRPIGVRDDIRVVAARDDGTLEVEPA